MTEAARLRTARAEDADGIDAVVEAAFGTEEGPVVARMVRDIRAGEHWRPELELVAADDEDRVIGLVGLSGTRLVHEHGSEREVLMLTPLSVLPQHQGRGIGSALVRRALELADAAGEPLVVLEGDPRFYGRLGFEHGTPRGIAIDLPGWAPPEAAQVAILSAHDPGDETLRGRVVHPDYVPVD